MLTLFGYIAIAAFIGLVILGHILLLQALFVGDADHADGKREPRSPRSLSPKSGS